MSQMHQTFRHLSSPNRVDIKLVNHVAHLLEVDCILVSSKDNKDFLLYWSRWSSGESQCYWRKTIDLRKDARSG